MIYYFPTFFPLFLSVLLTPVESTHLAGSKNRCFTTTKSQIKIVVGRFLPVFGLPCSPFPHVFHICSWSFLDFFILVFSVSCFPFSLFQVIFMFSLFSFLFSFHIVVSFFFFIFFSFHFFSFHCFTFHLAIFPFSFFLFPFFPFSFHFENHPLHVVSHAFLFCLCTFLSVYFSLPHFFILLLTSSFHSHSFHFLPFSIFFTFGMYLRFLPHQKKTLSNSNY